MTNPNSPGPHPMKEAISPARVDVERIKELLEKATPRPWSRGMGEVLMTGATDSLHRTVFITAIERGPIMRPRISADDLGEPEANAALIVAAVNALPRLIASTEAAEARAQALETLNNVLSEKLERRTLALQAAEQRVRELEAWAAQALHDTVGPLVGGGDGGTYVVNHLSGKTINAGRSLLSPAAPERSQGEGRRYALAPARSRLPQASDQGLRRQGSAAEPPPVYPPATGGEVMSEEDYSSVVEREEWRAVPGLEGYSASSHGRIKGPTGRFLNSLDRDGYKRVHRLVGRGGSAGHHELVALAFLGPCLDGCEVDHIDGRRDNNRPDNLRYVTHRENCRHFNGAGNPKAALTEAQAREILALPRTGLRTDPNSLSKIAARYAVGKITIADLLAGRTWGHLHEC